MNRRELLMVGAGTAIAHSVVTVAACSGQDGTTTDTPEGSSGGERGANADWARAAAECTRVGEICMDHCLKLLAEGNTRMGDCAKAVNVMLGICRAVGPVAAANSRHASALAALCAAVCADCRQACALHAGHHEECAACAAACEQTVAAARAVA